MSRGAMAVVVAGALLLAVGASAQRGRGATRAAAERREAAREIAARKQAAAQLAALRLAASRQLSRLRFTAAADMQRHAYTSAERAYQAILQLAPNDAEALRNLEVARAAGCHDAAWAEASRQDFAVAASALAACPGADSTAAGGDVALLRHLAAAAAALRQRNWGAATAAMQALPAPPLPAALADTLAPAWVRYGHGDRRGAATLARAPGLAASPLAIPFAAFLRNRYQHRLARVAIVPATAAFLLIFFASWWAALRRRPRLSERPA